MPWVRTGDNAFMYPAVQNIALLPGADEASPSQAYGVIHALYEHSAAHYTNYVVSVADLHRIARSRAWGDKILEWGHATGLLSWNTVPDEATGDFGSLRLLDDPDFIHIRTRAQRDAQLKYNGELQDWRLEAQVRLRDGDTCRWCATRVQREGRPSEKHWGKTTALDHLQFRTQDELTVDNIIVACKSCNSSRQNRTNFHRELQPAPAVPFYTRPTLALIAKAGLKLPQEYTSSTDLFDELPPSQGGQPVRGNNTPTASQAAGVPATSPGGDRFAGAPASGIAPSSTLHQGRLEEPAASQAAVSSPSHGQGAAARPAGALAGGIASPAAPQGFPVATREMGVLETAAVNAPQFAPATSVAIPPDSGVTENRDTRKTGFTGTGRDGLVLVCTGRGGAGMDGSGRDDSDMAREGFDTARRKRRRRSRGGGRR